MLQEAHAGEMRATSGTLPAKVPMSVQWLMSAGIAAFLLLSFLLTKSLIPIAALLGVALIVAMLRSPLLSVLGFMGINVLISVRPHEAGLGGAPTAVDLALGGALVIIIGYWFLKIRIFERQLLSASAAQLSL